MNMKFIKGMIMGGIVSAGVDGERCAEMCAKYLGVC